MAQFSFSWMRLACLASWAHHEQLRAAVAAPNSPDVPLRTQASQMYTSGPAMNRRAFQSPQPQNVQRTFSCACVTIDQSLA